MQRRIAILGVRYLTDNEKYSLTDNEKYLDHPLIIFKNKCKTFEPLVSKVKSRIKSWQAPLLFAGRNTLIKSVASALHVYNMFVLRFFQGRSWMILMESTVNFGGAILRVNVKGCQWVSIYPITRVVNFSHRGAYETYCFDIGEFRFRIQIHTCGV